MVSVVSLHSESSCANIKLHFYRSSDRMLEGRERERLRGAVRTVHEESAEFLKRDNEYEVGAPMPLRTIIFNENGSKSEEVTFAKDGSISRKFVFSPEGNIIEKIDYSGGEEDSSLRAAYTYNDGNLSELSVNAPGDVNVSKLESTYEGNDNLTEALFSIGGSFMGRSVVTHLKEGQQVEIANYGPDGSLITKIVFFYDDNGDQREVAQYAPDGELLMKVVYTHELDATGNWVKETKAEWDSATARFEPKEVIYRTINYY